MMEMIWVNKTIEDFHNELVETILKVKTKEDLLTFNSILEKRKEWIENYNNDDKRELLLYILEKDKEINKLLEEKKKTIMEKLLQEEEQDRNRGTYKLYE